MQKNGYDSIGRRSFLAGLAGLGMTSLATERARAVPDTAGKRYLCVFSKHLQFLDYEPMAETAVEIGFDGVDIPVRPGGHVLPENVERDLPRAVKACRDAGLAVPMITTAITDAEDQYTERILATAAEQDVRFYRLGYLSYDDSRDVTATLDDHARTIERIARLNEKYGLHGAYQNHAGTNVGGPVWDLWPLLKGLDPRWIGVQYDIRHATVEGGTAWPLGFRLLADYIRTTVIKDFKWVEQDGEWRVGNTYIGEGMVDFPRYYAMIREYGIIGPVSMHFEYPLEHTVESVVPAMTKDLTALRAIIRDAGLE